MQALLPRVDHRKNQGVDDEGSSCGEELSDDDRHQGLSAPEQLTVQPDGYQCDC